MNSKKQEAADLYTSEGYSIPPYRAYLVYHAANNQHTLQVHNHVGHIVFSREGYNLIPEEKFRALLDAKRFAENVAANNLKHLAKAMSGEKDEPVKEYTYKVLVPELHYSHRTVTAENEEEAIDKAMHSDCEYLEYSHIPAGAQIKIERED